MTESVYDQQVRRQLREATEAAARLRRERDSLEEEIGPLRRALEDALQRAAGAERRAQEWEQARDQECLNTAVVFHEYHRRWQSTIVEARRQAARAGRAEAALAKLHEGEEPVGALGLRMTAGQWIAAWNAQTPAERLQHAQRILNVCRELAALRTDEELAEAAS
ncbi:hypothetical protein [Kitasatospora camelliae]|uniref:Uncharacterized protein n=1 Tax=Kitasatospora camelliae TaxID=3156397 RepID=A0AAU8K489_9ACTN